MRLELSYATRYTYEPAAREGFTALRMRPRPRQGLVVVSSSIKVKPGVSAGSYIDSWGTLVDLVEVRSKHEAASFDVQAIVETEVEERDIPPRADELYMYTRESGRVEFAPVVSLLEQLPLAGKAWSSVEDVVAWMPQRFVYRIGATEAETPIAETIELGEGVCQDFAHVLLAMLRSSGWCARYVSGYAFNGEDGTDRIEAEAMHAWVEVYRPGTGWVAMDPTTGRYADDRYVVVGYGRDYDDVRPVRGILVGPQLQSQTSHLSMLRTVVEQQQQ